MQRISLSTSKSMHLTNGFCIVQCVHLKWNALKWMSFLSFMILPPTNTIKQNKECRLKYVVDLWWVVGERLFNYLPFIVVILIHSNIKRAALRVLHHSVNKVKYMNLLMLNQHIFRRHSNRKLYWQNDICNDKSSVNEKLFFGWFIYKWIHTNLI